MNKAFKRKPNSYYGSGYYAKWVSNPSRKYDEWLRVQPMRYIVKVLGKAKAKSFKG